MRYKTIVFDLDGTLLDTLRDLMEATNHALAAYGHPPRTLEEVRMFVGNGAGKLIERALPGGEENHHPDYEAVLAYFREYYTAHCEVYTCAYKGVMEMLRRLHEAGCRLAIVSNKPDAAVKELKEKYFAEYIHVAMGEREHVRRKPAKDMVELALTELGSSVSDALYVGDSDVDILTAANAGIPCVSVSWGFRDAAFLRAHGAERIVDAPEALCGVVLEG